MEYRLKQEVVDLQKRVNGIVRWLFLMAVIWQNLVIGAYLDSKCQDNVSNLIGVFGTLGNAMALPVPPFQMGD